MARSEKTGKAFVTETSQRKMMNREKRSRTVIGPQLEPLKFCALGWGVAGVSHRVLLTQKPVLRRPCHPG